MIRQGPISVGISGCGAAVRLYHAPALQRLQSEGMLKVKCLFDPDQRALAGVAETFPLARRASRFADITAAPPELVLIASPPAFHAAQAAAALQAGSAVLCEKPLATVAAAARRVVELARDGGRVLAVGMIRRYLPATRAIREAVQTGAIGRVRRFHCFEGGPFDWPVGGPSYFTKQDSGGGALMDIGVHALDLLGWWFGGCTALSYEDDAMGGVESDCRVKLAFGDVEGVLRISRSWRRPNLYEIAGTKGRLVWEVNEAERVGLWLENGPNRLEAAVREGAPSGFHDALLEQLRAIVSALGGEPHRFVSGQEALPALELVDRCYADRRVMEMGWLDAEERLSAEVLAGSAA